MKKIFAIMMAVAVVGLSFTACKKDKNEPEKPLEVVKVEANNLSVYTNSYFDMYLYYYGYAPVYFEGNNENWAVAGMFCVTEEGDFYGDYSKDTLNAISVYDMKKNNEEFSLKVSSLKYEKVAAGKQLLAVGTDSLGRKFDIKLTFFAPEEPKDTIEVAFDESSALYYATTGDYYVYAKGDKYIVTLDIYTDDLAGTYTTDDFESKYTHLYVINAGDTTSLGEFFTAKATVTLSGDVYTMNVELLMQDENLYKLTIPYQKPTAKEAKDWDVNVAELDDWRWLDGTFTICAYSADSTIRVDLSPLSETLDGAFTEKSLDPEYTGFTDYTEKVGYSIVSADFTGTLNAAGTEATYTGWFMASNEVKYNFTFVCALEADDDDDAAGAPARNKKQRKHTTLLKSKIERCVK